MLEKIIKYFGLAVLLVAALISLLYFVMPNAEPQMQAAMDALDGATGADKIAGVDAAATEWDGFIMYACEFLAIACAILFVLFGLIGIVVDGLSSPKTLIKPAIAIIGIVVVAIIAKVLANGCAPDTIGIIKAGYIPSVPGPDAIPYKDIEYAEAGLYMTYIVGAAAVLALIYGAISRLWK
jgi:hypothetical protein